MLHQLGEGDVDLQLLAQLLDEHHAGQGVQTGLVEVLVHADGVDAHDGGGDVEEFLLKLGGRQQELSLLLLLVLFVLKVDLTDDLFGGGLREGLTADLAAADFGVGGQLFIAQGYDLVHSRLNIMDAVDLSKLEVGIDLGGDAVPVTEGDDVLNELVAVELVLDQLRGHVLAVAEDDEVLFSAVEVEEAVLVHIAQVAGAEPAVLGEGLGGELRVVDVAHHHGGALHLNFAVHKANLSAPDGLAHAGQLLHIAVVGR